MIDLKVLSKGEYEKMKKEARLICVGFHESPFGKCLIGLFGDRICHFSFVNVDESTNLNVLKSQWPGSTLIEEENLTFEVTKRIFEDETGFFKVLLKGTPFEGRVWQELLNIPKGETASYEDVAAAAGNARAVRAAANAVAKNPVAYLVPCHRVIRKDGSLHKYGWGSRIKQEILQFEKMLPSETKSVYF